MQGFGDNTTHSWTQCLDKYTEIVKKWATKQTLSTRSRGGGAVLQQKWLRFTGFESTWIHWCEYCSQWEKRVFSQKWLSIPAITRTQRRLSVLKGAKNKFVGVSVSCVFMRATRRWTFNACQRRCSWANLTARTLEAVHECRGVRLLSTKDCMRSNATTTEVGGKSKLMENEGPRTQHRSSRSGGTKWAISLCCRKLQNTLHVISISFTTYVAHDIYRSRFVITRSMWWMSIWISACAQCVIKVHLLVLCGCILCRFCLHVTPRKTNASQPVFAVVKTSNLRDCFFITSYFRPLKNGRAGEREWMIHKVIKRFVFKIMFQSTIYASVRA